jgi:hypothetical protein
MDIQRFDAIGRWLAVGNSRRSTLRGLVGSALAIGMGRLTLEEAAAACKNAGKKCKKAKECCSGACKGKKGKKTCRCRTVRQSCTGTFSENTCCGELKCATNGAGEPDRCCKVLEDSCSSNSDCCIAGAECRGGECCLGEGVNCLFAGSDACCAGLFCDTTQGSTCQPPN